MGKGINQNEKKPKTQLSSFAHFSTRLLSRGIKLFWAYLNDSVSQQNSIDLIYTHCSLERDISNMQ